MSWLIPSSTEMNCSVEKQKPVPDPSSINILRYSFDLKEKVTYFRILIFILFYPSTYNCALISKLFRIFSYCTSKYVLRIQYLQNTGMNLQNSHQGIQDLIIIKKNTDHFRITITGPTSVSATTADTVPQRIRLLIGQ